MWGYRRSILALVAVCVAAASLPAQTAWDRREPLRVYVNLVLVPVTVTDRHGQFVGGLDRSQFQVFEDGVPKAIASFTTEELPAAIGLVLDVSGSMNEKLATARTFTRSLLAALDSEDEALFLTCADRPDIQADLTHDLGSLERILESARPGGWTALVDSIDVTIDRLRAARNSRKVLVIVSDGQDNRSRHSKRELISKAVESEAQIYSIAIREPPGSRKAIELVEENQGLAFLADLAQATGGLYLQIDSEADLSAAAERVSRTLHHQYLIGYYPTPPVRNGLRRIKVKLDMPDVRLYARSLYYGTSP